MILYLVSEFQCDNRIFMEALSDTHLDGHISIIDFSFTKHIVDELFFSSIIDRPDVFCFNIDKSDEKSPYFLQAMKVINAIKRNDFLKNIPIVVLTSFIGSDSIPKFESMGVDKVIHSEFSYENYIECLNQIFSFTLNRD